MYKKGNKVLKRLYSSKRLKAMGLALLIGCTAAVAQNSAGDYTAGTTALSTVAEEITFAKISYLLNIIFQNSKHA